MGFTRGNGAFLGKTTVLPGKTRVLPEKMVALLRKNSGFLVHFGVFYGNFVGVFKGLLALLYVSFSLCLSFRCCCFRLFQGLTTT